MAGKYVDGGDKAGLIPVDHNGVVSWVKSGILESEMFHSERAAEIIGRQKPIDKAIIKRVEKSLAGKGVTIHQSEDANKWLISKGAEAVTFSDGMIIMHTDVSASGFFEELIHYGQIKNGRAIAGDMENNILMEIEAKERLITHRKAYGLTDYEVEALTEGLSHYKMELEILRKAGD